VIPYYPLSDAMLGSIIRLQLGRIEKRIADGQQIPFTWSNEVVELIASRCTELESGGRMIDAILTNSVLPAISSEILNRMLRNEPATQVAVGVQGGEFSYDFEARRGETV